MGVSRPTPPDSRQQRLRRARVSIFLRIHESVLSTLRGSGDIAFVYRQNWSYRGDGFIRGQSPAPRKLLVGRRTRTHLSPLRTGMRGNTRRYLSSAILGFVRGNYSRVPAGSFLQTIRFGCDLGRIIAKWSYGRYGRLRRTQFRAQIHGFEGRPGTWGASRLAMARRGYTRHIEYKPLAWSEPKQCGRRLV